MKYFRWPVWVFIIALGLTMTIVRAGNLTGSGAQPAATFYTLQDLCNRLTTNVSATEGSHSFTAPSGTPSGTQCTLTQLYNLIPASADASKIKIGTTYFGITGTYPSASNPLPGDTAAADATTADICNAKEAWGKNGTLMTGTLTVDAAKFVAGNIFCGIAGTANKNMYNGTGQGQTGGASGGGVDDYNNGDAAPSDRYSCVWTACNSGNNYCGTGAAGADAKDECTGLVWSKACSGTGCAALDNGQSNAYYYSWDNSFANNSGMTAAQLCSQGSHGQSGWYLPHQRHLMQAYINGFYGNGATPGGLSGSSWSATAYGDNPGEAWVNSLRSGSVSGNAISSTDKRVRCIRPN